MSEGDHGSKLVSSTTGGGYANATVVFASLGKYKAHLSVRATRADGSFHSTASSSRALVCSYVRRSLRGLVKKDRDAFLDAMKTMIEVEQGQGIDKFGDDYRPISHFSRIHLRGAGGRVSDHMHDGMGFLTQHAALTSEFELALQSIAKTMAVPYWDYTVEGEIVRGAGTLAAAWNTPLWTDNAAEVADGSEAWFGEAKQVGHTVQSGRFAWQTIDKDYDNDVHNAYGYLRAPWNVNDSPYLTRAHKFCNQTIGYELWPSCGMHWNLTFDTGYNTWYQWVWDAGYAPHGPIHDYIGGYTNCGNLHEDLLNILPTGAIDSFAKFMVVLPKSLYRAFYLTPPEYCTEDTPVSDCHSTCSLNPDDPNDVDEMMQVIMSLGSHLQKTGVALDYNWIADLDEHASAQLMRVICTTPFSPGEQLEAGSPADVSFWSIHPTMERLFQCVACCILLPPAQCERDVVRQTAGETKVCLARAQVQAARERLHRDRLAQPGGDESVRRLEQDDHVLRPGPHHEPRRGRGPQRDAVRRPPRGRRRALLQHDQERRHGALRKDAALEPAALHEDQPERLPHALHLRLFRVGPLQ